MRGRLFPWIVRVWNWRLGNWDFAPKLAMFSEYLDFHMSVPEIHSKGGLRSSAIPFHQFLRAILLSKLGYRPETVQDVPVQRALWDYYAWAEMEGHLTVLPQTAEEIEEALAALKPDELLARATNRN
jgi:hypothetical protein